MPRLPSLACALLACGLVAAGAPPRPENWSGPVTIGAIDTPLVAEASGLAVSRRAPGVLWTHNDSGGLPVLYAIDHKGNLLGSVRVNGRRNLDWEDISSFVLDGRACLLIADTGDNNGNRHDCSLIIIAEPDPAALSPARELNADVLRTIPVRYPDGPRDCESVAVDAPARLVYLISKRTTPPMVCSLPLRPDPADPRPLAKTVGPLRGILPPTGLLSHFNIPQGRYRAEPCALDLTADGRTAVVLTYGETYIYQRKDSETWAQAFAGNPVVLAAHGLPQAEGACFTDHGKAIVITTEGHPAPLLRYLRP
jgi:hypothetical protein